MTTASPPRVDVVVPVYNEAPAIAAKVANLAALTYPADRLRVHVVDGGSSDGTVTLALGAAAERGLALDVTVVPAASKPLQVNHAARRGDAPYVLVTDADACLPPSIVERLVDELERDPGCALVGTALRSASPVVLEQVYWHYSNRLRAAEARVLGSAGLVVGPCYVVRRSALEPFDEDVVSDDAHLCLSALVRGFRVAYVDVEVRELRGPATLAEFARHKHRKAGAYLREVIRVAARRGWRSRGSRAVLMVRVLLLAVVPWCLAAAAAAILWAWPLQGVVVAGLSAAAAASWSAVRRHPWPAIAGGIATVALPWVVAGLLIASMLALPFVRLSPSYPKVTLFADPEA
ncbi:MAG: glycosyltransferase [Acidobacteria bacterium]|nr:glycosyltransferase [Acidobacteriota bacterium]